VRGHINVAAGSVCLQRNGRSQLGRFGTNSVLSLNWKSQALLLGLTSAFQNGEYIYLNSRPTIRVASGLNEDVTDTPSPQLQELPGRQELAGVSAAPVHN
jgi:hypothetical protein